MRLHHTAEAPLALVAGSLVVGMTAWGQAPGNPGMPSPMPAAASDGISRPMPPPGVPETEPDIGDRSGGPASCMPVYTQDARLLGTPSGNPERDDYGFALTRVECSSAR